MQRDKFQITKPNEFRVINERYIDKSMKIYKEAESRKKGIHHKTFKSSTLRQIFKERFRLSKKEIEKLIYQTLSEHPEGLSFRQLKYFTGLGRKMINRAINDLKEKLISGHRGIFIRKINKCTILYYTDKDSRKIAKQIMKTELEYIELEKKLKEMNNGK